MRGHQKVAPDEEVELHEMDVPGFTDFGGMQDDEQVVGVGMHLGEMAAVQHILDRQAVEAELLDETASHLLVARWEVDPHESARLVEQTRDLAPGPLFGSIRGDPAHER